MCLASQLTNNDQVSLVILEIYEKDHNTDWKPVLNNENHCQSSMLSSVLGGGIPSVGSKESAHSKHSIM